MRHAYGRAQPGGARTPRHNRALATKGTEVPFLKYEGLARVTQDQVADTLRQSVSAPRWFNWSRPSTPFVGTVSGTGFRITRVVAGRDSFNPMLYGRFLASASGTRVKVVMTYHPAVWLFLLAWTGGTGYGVISSLREHEGVVHIPLFFMISAWVMAVPFFYIGAFRSRELLQQRLGLKEIPEFGG